MFFKMTWPIWMASRRLRSSKPAAARRSAFGRLKHLLFARHPWKADFNQCSGPQLIAALKRARRSYAGNGGLLPFVMIGHSKTYGRYNEATLEKFLEFVSSNPGDFRYAIYRDLLEAK